MPLSLPGGLTAVASLALVDVSLVLPQRRGPLLHAPLAPSTCGDAMTNPHDPNAAAEHVCEESLRERAGTWMLAWSARPSDPSTAWWRPPGSTWRSAPSAQSRLSIDVPNRVNHLSFRQLTKRHVKRAVRGARYGERCAFRSRRAPGRARPLEAPSRARVPELSAGFAPVNARNQDAFTPANDESSPRWALGLPRRDDRP